MLTWRIFLCAYGIVFVNLLSSCEQEKKTGKDIDSLKRDQSTYTHQLVASKSLIFSIDQETSVSNFFYDAFTIRGTEYFGMINRNNNSLQIYSIPGGNLYAKIKFDEEGPNAFPKLGAFTVVNQDSILVLNQYGKDLWLVDISGTVHRKFNAMNLDKTLFSLSTTFYTGKKPLFSDNKLYIKSLSKNIDNFRLPFFDADNYLEIEIDLIKETWKYVHVSFPSVYKGNIWRFDVSRDFGKDGSIIYSFAADPYLYEYDREKWNTTRYPAESEYVKSIKPLSKPDDQDEAARYFLETPKYSNFIYDKYRDVYYRFVSHGISPVNPITGERNTFDDTPFSIIILDGTLRKIGETKVEDGRYQINCYFVSKDGLFLSNCNPKNPNLNEDELSFTRFELQELKSNN